MAVSETRIPPPLLPAPATILAVGRYGPSHVDAEDVSRRLGNWGNASRLIGDRWEALAAGLLRRRLPWSAPLGGGRVLAVDAVLGLDADPVAGPALQRAGVSAPDLLMVGRLGSGGRLALRAVDCKVSLDTAEREQTAPARLQGAFERIARGHPAVVEALRTQACALDAAGRAAADGALAAALRGSWDTVVVVEGLFVAPDNGFNRWFLDQLEARRRTGAALGRLPASGPRRPPAETRGPVDAAQAARLHLPAHLEPATAAAFLGGLPGWPEAEVVAALDRVALDAVDLAVAERCWRVGAGLRGAIRALRRPLFRPALEAAAPAGGPPRDVAAVLRQVAARRRAADSADLVRAVAHSVVRRRALWEREQSVLAPPLTFGAWAGLLAEARSDRAGLRTAVAEGAAGSNPAAGADPRDAAARALALAPARALYREASARHRRRVLAAAADLAGKGLDEVRILEALEERAAEWRAAAMADAAELAASIGGPVEAPQAGTLHV